MLLFNSALFQWLLFLNNSHWHLFSISLVTFALYPKPDDEDTFSYLEKLVKYTTHTIGSKCNARYVLKHYLMSPTEFCGFFVLNSWNLKLSTVEN